MKNWRQCLLSLKMGCASSSSSRLEDHHRHVGQLSTRGGRDESSMTSVEARGANAKGKGRSPKKFDHKLELEIIKASSQLDDYSQIGETVRMLRKHLDGSGRGSEVEEDGNGASGIKEMFIREMISRYVCSFIYMLMHTYKYSYMHILIHTYAHTYMHTYTHTCIYSFILILIYMLIYLYAHTCIYIYTYAHIWAYIYIYIYVYMHI